jgi:hypothetical protein
VESRERPGDLSSESGTRACTADDDRAARSDKHRLLPQHGSLPLRAVKRHFGAWQEANTPPQPRSSEETPKDRHRDARCGANPVAPHDDARVHLGRCGKTAGAARRRSATRRSPPDRLSSAMSVSQPSTNVRRSVPLRRSSPVRRSHLGGRLIAASATASSWSAFGGRLMHYRTTLAARRVPHYPDASGEQPSARAFAQKSASMAGRAQRRRRLPSRLRAEGRCRGRVCSGRRRSAQPR